MRGAYTRPVRNRFIAPKAAGRATWDVLPTQNQLDRTRHRLVRLLAAAGLRVAPGEAIALAAYIDEIRRWNRVHNLTAVTGLDEIVRRHVIESLSLRPMLEGSRIADIGTGAGVPGLPLAIMEPRRHFTLIESRGKRAAFLRHVQGRLGLENIAVKHCRVESMTDAGPFDTLLARAVAPPGEVLRLASGLFGRETVLLMPVGQRVASEPAPGEDRFDVRREKAMPPWLGGSLLVVRRKGE